MKSSQNNTNIHRCICAQAFCCEYILHTCIHNIFVYGRMMKSSLPDQKGIILSNKVDML